MRSPRDRFGGCRSLARTIGWLLSKPPAAVCSAEADKTHENRATKVVGQPWLGKHQVHGIFMVPHRYRYIGTLRNTQ